MIGRGDIVAAFVDQPHHVEPVPTGAVVADAKVVAKVRLVSPGALAVTDTLDDGTRWRDP
jgi:hypothetical protein